MDTDSNIPVTPEETAESKAPTQSSFTTPSKKRSPKLIIGGIIAGALVLFAGGGALAYTQWYQNEDKVVHDAIINVMKAHSIQTTGTVVYSDKDTKVTLDLDGKSDTAHGEFNVKATIAIDNEDMKRDFNLSGSGRMVDETLYVKVSGIKKVIETMSEETNEATPAYLSTVVDKIEDKWISIKASDYKDIDEELAKQQECLTGLSGKIQSDKTMSNEVTQLYRDHQIVVTKETLGSKRVNGTSSLGYKVAVDRDAAVAFIKGLKDTALGKEMKNCNDDVDFDTIADSIAKETTTETQKAPTIELWISRFGHTITEVSVAGDTSSSSALHMTLQPRFNDTVSVEAPKDATSLKTIMEDIQSAITDYYTGLYSAEAASFDSSSSNFQLSI